MLASEPEREGTPFGVRLTCYGLRLEVTCFKMHPRWPCSQSMAQVKQTMMPLMRPRKSGSEIPNIFLPLKYFPHMASGIWGARNRLVICWVMFIRISSGRAHLLAHTYLIPPPGAHKSIPLQQVVHSTCNRCQVVGEIIQISNSILYVENKLGSYCRVSRAYLSHLVSTPAACVMFKYQRRLTNFKLASDAAIFPASDMSSRAFSQDRWTSDIKVAGAGIGLTNRVYRSMRVLARLITSAAAPMAIFRRDLVPGKMCLCRGVLRSAGGLQLLTADVVALWVASGDEYGGTLEDMNVGGV